MHAGLGGRPAAAGAFRSLTLHVPPKQKAWSRKPHLTESSGTHFFCVTSHLKHTASQTCIGGMPASLPGEKPQGHAHKDPPSGLIEGRPHHAVALRADALAAGPARPTVLGPARGRRILAEVIIKALDQVLQREGGMARERPEG